ncbi:hypothetical protein J6590_026682 [Homalodisca vitripennis]|nr:hypothetical protein J6590_026682 [Homalodisca vitripennis]
MKSSSKVNMRRTSYSKMETITSISCVLKLLFKYIFTVSSFNGKISTASSLVKRALRFETIDKIALQAQATRNRVVRVQSSIASSSNVNMRRQNSIASSGIRATPTASSSKKESRSASSIKCCKFKQWEYETAK